MSTSVATVDPTPPALTPTMIKLAEELLQVTFSCPLDNYEWAGWQAALIRSKQRTPKHKDPPHDCDVKLPDGFSSPVHKKAKSAQDMDLDAENDCVLGMGHNFHVSRLPLTDSATQCSTRPAEVCEEKQKIAEVVAAATGLVARYVTWSCLPRGILRIHEFKVWRCIMKAVRSIIDLDAINAEANSMRQCKYRGLFSKLNSFVHVDKVSQDEVRFDKDLVMLMEKFQSEVMNRIAGGNESDIGAEDFVGLSEADVADLIKCHIIPRTTESMVYAWSAECFKLNRPKEMVRAVLKEMETFVPLKEDREMQLVVELSVKTRGHVLDYLFLEACKGFMSEEFFKDLDEELVGSNRTSEGVLSRFAESLYKGIRELASYKFRMLKYSDRGVRFPLTQGAFGNFSEEAIGAVRIANHERRRRGSRFIGLRDILFGLSCAGYLKDFDDMGLRELPEMPLYRFYKLAGECAKSIGAESVEIEHLVWAFLTIVGQHDEAEEYLKTRVQRMDESRRGSVFTDTYKDKGLLHNGKPICGFKALVSAIREGLELPDIRKEH